MTGSKFCKSVFEASDFLKSNKDCFQRLSGKEKEMGMQRLCDYERSWNYTVGSSSSVCIFPFFYI